MPDDAAPPTSPDTGESAATETVAPHHGTTALLHEFIGQTDGTCPLCSYDLRSMSSDRCPECGHQLTLEIRLAQPKLGRWVTLFLFAAVSFGWSTSFGLIALSQASARWFATLAGMLLIATTLFSLPLLIVVLRARRRFLLLPVATQRLITTLVGIVTLGILAIFILVFDDR